MSYFYLWEAEEKNKSIKLYLMTKNIKGYLIKILKPPSPCKAQNNYMSLALCSRWKSQEMSLSLKFKVKCFVFCSFTHVLSIWAKRLISLHKVRVPRDPIDGYLKLWKTDVIWPSCNPCEDSQKALSSCSNLQFLVFWWALKSTKL